jgi:hypothetical protein
MPAHETARRSSPSASTAFAHGLSEPRLVGHVGLEGDGERRSGAVARRRVAVRSEPSRELSRALAVAVHDGHARTLLDQLVGRRRA